MRKGAGLLGIAIIGVAIIASIIATYVISFDPKSGAAFDGFGRQLTEAPRIVQDFFGFILVGSKAWAGLGWFLLDWSLGAACLLTGAWLIKWGFSADTK